MSANSNKQTDAMNNFLLLIKTSKGHVKSLSPRQLAEQVIALRNFIESQMSAGRLMIAYPRRWLLRTARAYGGSHE
jgi:hypothetical protein